MLVSSFPRVEYWLFGRLDGVSSGEQGVLVLLIWAQDGVPPGEQKDFSFFLRRTWVDYARIPDDGGSNGGPQSVWK